MYMVFKKKKEGQHSLYIYHHYTKDLYIDYWSFKIDSSVCLYLNVLKSIHYFFTAYAKHAQVHAN